MLTIRFKNKAIKSIKAIKYDADLKGFIYRAKILKSVNEKQAFIYKELLKEKKLRGLKC